MNDELNSLAIELDWLEIPNDVVAASLRVYEALKAARVVLQHGITNDAFCCGFDKIPEIARLILGVRQELETDT